MSLAGVILGICGILLALGMLVYAVISEPDRIPGLNCEAAEPRMNPESY